MLGRKQTKSYGIRKEPVCVDKPSNQIEMRYISAIPHVILSVNKQRRDLKKSCTESQYAVFHHLLYLLSHRGTNGKWDGSCVAYARAGALHVEFICEEITFTG
jgi:hypothetical protein